MLETDLYSIVSAKKPEGGAVLVAEALCLADVGDVHGDMEPTQRAMVPEASQRHQGWGGISNEHSRLAVGFGDVQTMQTAG